MTNFKAGRYISQGSYKSFQPNRVNRAWDINNMEILELLSKADRQLGRLDMYSEYVPDVDLFVNMHVAREATQSSRIEGTRTTVEEVLLEREEIEPEKQEDWDEVRNYIEAMNTAVKQLQRLPISTRLICNTHRVLIQGVRGQHKKPGDFRTSQNWIGGASIEDALFIPPHPESIPDLMNDLEQFIHNDDIHLPELIRIAIIHYQFETIHPFLDGNGRVGRLLITLHLADREILKQPILYLSDFFERNRSKYYDNLMLAHENDNIDQWIKFFLVGVAETARDGVQAFDRIMRLQKRIDDQLESLGRRASNARKVVRALYERPVITADRASEVADISMPTAYNVIESLESLNILDEVTGAERNRRYVFKEYLDLFRS